MTTTRRNTLAGLAASTVLARSVAAQPASRQPVTLELMTWQWEEAGFGAWWKEVTAAFQQQTPSIRLSVTPVPYAAYLDQLTIRFASNRAPALVALSTDSLGAFASQGWFEPLDARIKGTPIESSWSSLQSNLVWDGKTQGVLLMGYGFMMFYNAALLDAAGVAVPRDFDAFNAAVPRITDRARGIFGLSAVTSEYPTIMLDLIRNIAWSGQSLLRDGRYALTEPGVVAAMERYRAVVGQNAPLGNDSTVIRQLFVDGRSGFLVDGPWVNALLARARPELRDQLRMVRAPFSPVLGGASNSLHIAAGKDQATQDAAWTFIEFATSVPWQQRYTVLTSAAAPLRGALTPELAQAHPALVEINAAVTGAVSVVPANQALRANYAEFNKILARTAVRLVATATPVPEVLRQAQRELERAAPLS